MTDNEDVDRYSEEMYAHVSEGLPESIDQDNYVVGVYYAAFSSQLDPYYMGQVVVEEQTTGSYVPKYSNPNEIQKKFSAKVVAIYEVPPYEIGFPKGLDERQYIYHVAYPTAGIGSQLPLMLTTLMGNISMGGKIKLLDVIFPKKFLRQFKGPKYGIEGIRKQLNVSNRPLLTCIDHAYTIEDGVTLFRDLAMGGADIIKDDESMANFEHLMIEERVNKYMETRDKVKDETGEETIYTVNITDDPHKIKENALAAIDAGANGLMINYLTVGLPVVRWLAEDPEIKLPILGHMDFAGVYYESPMSGISSYLIIGKLARLVGLDALVYPSAYGKATFLKDKYLGCAKALRYPFGHLKPTFPMPSGGVTPAMAIKMISDLGTDIMVGVGTYIQKHPEGILAGTRAFRQVIDIAVNHFEEASEDLEDFVEDHDSDYPELSKILED